MSDFLKNKWVNIVGLAMSLLVITGSCIVFIGNIDKKVYHMESMGKAISDRMTTLSSAVSINTEKTSENVSAIASLKDQDKYYDLHISEIEREYVTKAEFGRFGEIIHKDHQDSIREASKRVAEQGDINSSLYQAIISCKKRCF